MASEVRGVVATAKGAPVTVETVIVPDPGPGEVVVKVQACGVCHTDLHYKEGAINDDFPFLLGHEAAGMVDAVGPDVANVAVGRLRGAGLAGAVRAVPVVPAGPALVLLRQRQRHAEDDPGRRHPPQPGPGHRRLRGEDAGGRGPGGEGRPPGPARRRPGSSAAA